MSRELLKKAIDALDIVNPGAFFDADPDGKIQKAIDAINDELEKPASVINEFKELGGHEIEEPLERLRFFCSLAMSSTNWIEVEQFFTEVGSEMAKPALKRNSKDDL